MRENSCYVGKEKIPLKYLKKKKNLDGILKVWDNFVFTQQQLYGSFISLTENIILITTF